MANITAYELNFAREIRRPSSASAVHLRCEIIEHTNEISAIKQFVRQMRSDEPGSAGDEDLLRHRFARIYRTKRLSVTVRKCLRMTSGLCPCSFVRHKAVAIS